MNNLDGKESSKAIVRGYATRLEHSIHNRQFDVAQADAELLRLLARADKDEEFANSQEFIDGRKKLEQAMEADADKLHDLVRMHRSITYNLD